jgi:hypothetical protein
MHTALAFVGLRDTQIRGASAGEALAELVVKLGELEIALSATSLNVHVEQRLAWLRVHPGVVGIPVSSSTAAAECV